MIQIANAPCSWGILEFDTDREEAGYEQVLDEMRETGYAGTELGDWGFMPTDPAQLAAALAARELALVGAFVPVALSEEAAHEAGEEAALRTARLLATVAGGRHKASPYIVLADDNAKAPARTANAGRIGPEQGLSEARWDTFAAGAERIARAVSGATGLRTVFHHHGGGFVETPEEIDTLMDMTDPELLGLCLDTGHYRFGGGDPIAALEKYGSRIWHVHFKDHDPAVAAEARRQGWDYHQSVGHGIFCELGRGDVDFMAVRDGLRLLGYDGWIVVEQDVLPGTGSPKASARRNREYLLGMGL